VEEFRYSWIHEAPSPVGELHWDTASMGCRGGGGREDGPSFPVSVTISHHARVKPIRKATTWPDVGRCRRITTPPPDREAEDGTHEAHEKRNQGARCSPKHASQCEQDRGDGVLVDADSDKKHERRTDHGPNEIVPRWWRQS
tara:strand:- start:268 stop:693 length:426 start_codon:yes stop_codon:yes gene_type:complete